MWTTGLKANGFPAKRRAAACLATGCKSHRDTVTKGKPADPISALKSFCRGAIAFSQCVDSIMLSETARKIIGTYWRCPGRINKFVSAL